MLSAADVGVSGSAQRGRPVHPGTRTAAGSIPAGTEESSVTLVFVRVSVFHPGGIRWLINCFTLHFYNIRGIKNLNSWCLKTCVLKIPQNAFSVSLTPQEEITGPEHLKITYLTRGILLNAVIVVKQRSVFVRSSL